jgi:sugar lactone lactonase YvrE/murein DD-endopeptidase MepM/ murein hydrolase activator NlpD
VTGSRWKPTVILIAAALLVAALSVAVTIWRRLSPDAPPPLSKNWAARTLVLAGDGVRDARDGDLERARFSEPFGLAVAADGSIYVADAGDAHRIRRLSPDGRVVTVAGGAPGLADGAGEAARFSTPSGLAIDAEGTLFVADTGNNVIRRVTPDGRVSIYAGDGTAGHRDGPADAARFNGPIGIALDGSGRLIVADTYNDRIRAVDRRGTVTTLAGGAGPGWTDGPAHDARFHTPSGVAVGPGGTIVVADTGNGLVRTIDAAGKVTTPAWTYGAGLFRPIGIAVAPGGDLYVADERGLIVEATTDGAVRTLAGSTPGFRDGAGIDARFRAPSAVAVIAPGRLVVADAGNALLRLVAAASRLEMRLPPSPLIDPRFDAARFGRVPLLWPVAPFEGPHEVAGTMGEARGGDAERFHAGVDVRIAAGTPVRAVRDGVVNSPVAGGGFGTLSEYVRIGDVAYVHVRAARDARNDVFDLSRFVPVYQDGKLVDVRVKRGARFSTGDTVGTVNAFNHVHLNVGWPGEEVNPLAFGPVQFEDTVAPTIARGGVRVFDEHGGQLTARRGGRVIVSGRVQIVIDAWDQANGNRADRRLGLYDVGYQVLRPDGRPAPGFETVRHTLRFDQLSEQAGAAALVYAPGSGIPFYGTRRTQFLYRATTTLRDGVAEEGFWDTAQLPPGDYVLRAWVADFHGNVATANRDLPVTTVSTADASPAGRAGSEPSPR